MTLLHPGANLVLTVDRLDHDGAGVADVQTDSGLFRLHVAGALPGEQVRARVAHVSPHAREQGQDAWADLGEIATAAPQRVAPPCPAHRRCGGCPLACWAYAAQVEWKRELVVGAMATQLLDVPVAACVPSPQPFGYRGTPSMSLDTTATAGWCWGPTPHDRMRSWTWPAAPSPSRPWPRSRRCS